VLLLIAGTVWLLKQYSRGAEVAGVLSLTLAVLLAVTQLPGMPWRSPDSAKLADEARGLARAVAKRETAEQNLLLADSGRGQPADITFAPAEQVTWRSAVGDQSGSLGHIADFYAGSEAYPGLDDGRLVILGEAGAGKTVLANKLLLDLINHLLAGDTSPNDEWRVPVRLSLPAFDPGTDDDQISAEVVASRLDDWISGQLVKVFGLPAPLAEAMVERGRILPVLDGLDEMDRGTGEAVRAAATVRALNYPAAGGARPFVVTCRNERYRQLITTQAQPGQRETVLQDVAVIELQPLTPERVAAYLTTRFPDPADRAQIQPRWQPVLDRLKTEPYGPLAAALSLPLRLFMALTTYYQRDTHPAKLCELPADAIHQHLFESFIPAVTGQHPRHGGGYYSETAVTRWLTTLADYLRVCQTREGGSGSDIYLHELWSAAGNRTPRYAAAALHTLLTLIAGFTAAWLLYDPARVMGQPWRSLVLGAVTLLVPLTFLSAGGGPVSLKRINLSQLRTSRGRSRIAVSFIGGFVFGIGIMLAPPSDPAGAVNVGLGMGIITSLYFTATSRPAAISRPHQLVTQGLAHDLTILLGCGLGFGFMMGFTFGPVAGFFGGAAGLAIGSFLLADSPWLRYFVATRILARRCQLPPRPGLFLDWAYAAGLLRLAGIAIQFRHRDLQDQLVSTPASPTAGKSNASSNGAVRFWAGTQRPPDANAR
jgi:hypothetical protein